MLRRKSRTDSYIWILSCQRGSNPQAWEGLKNKEGEKKRRPEPSKCQHTRDGQQKNQGWTFSVCVSSPSESKSIASPLSHFPPPCLWACAHRQELPHVCSRLFSPSIVHCHRVFVFQLNEEGFAGSRWCSHLLWGNWAQALSHKTHLKCLPESLPPPLCCCSLWSLSVSHSVFKKLAHVVV